MNRDELRFKAQKIKIRMQQNNRSSIQNYKVLTHNELIENKTKLFINQIGGDFSNEG